jgi:hypothetical protein
MRIAPSKSLSADRKREMEISAERFACLARICAPREFKHNNKTLGGNGCCRPCRVIENGTVRRPIQLFGNKNIAVSANTARLDELYALKEPNETI